MGRPDALSFGCLGNCQGVFKLDSGVTNGAVPLRGTEQQQDGAKVPNLSVYLGDLGATHRVEIWRFSWKRPWQGSTEPTIRPLFKAGREERMAGKDVSVMLCSKRVLQLENSAARNLIGQYLSFQGGETAPPHISGRSRCW